MKTRLGHHQYNNPFMQPQVLQKSVLRDLDSKVEFLKSEWDVHQKDYMNEVQA